MMRTLGIIALVIIVLVGGTYSCWMTNYPTFTYRYRLTIEVDVDGETKTGASVIEVRNQKQPKFGDSPTVLPKASGEAVFVDLGENGHVIAILGFGPNGSDPDHVWRVVLKRFGVSLEDRDLVELPSLRGSRELTGYDIPTLVTFSDLNDPKTARVVQPHEFPQVFGEGVRFRRATIEMTSDAVTQKIEKQVPFLKPMRDAQRGKSVLSYPGKLNVLPPLFIRS